MTELTDRVAVLALKEAERLLFGRLIGAINND